MIYYAGDSRRRVGDHLRSLDLLRLARSPLCCGAPRGQIKTHRSPHQGPVIGGRAAGRLPDAAIIRVFRRRPAVDDDHAAGGRVQQLSDELMRASPHLTRDERLSTRRATLRSWISMRCRLTYLRLKVWRQSRRPRPKTS